MRVRFRSTNGEFDADEYSLICGVDGFDDGGAEHALSFDRISEMAAEEDPSDDRGVHAQFDDQSNGGYDRVSQCRLSRMLLSVDLSGQLGGLSGVEGFDVELDITDEMYDSIKGGLSRIFRGMQGVLMLGDASEPNV